MLGIYCKNHHKPRQFVGPSGFLQIWTIVVDHIISYHIHIISYHIISYYTIFHISHLIYHMSYVICHKSDIIYHIYIYYVYIYMMFIFLLIVVVHNYIISYLQNNSMKLLPLRPRTPRWSSSAWPTSWSSRRTRSCSTTPRPRGVKRVFSNVWKPGNVVNTWWNSWFTMIYPVKLWCSIVIYSYVNVYQRIHAENVLKHERLN